MGYLIYGPSKIPAWLVIFWMVNPGNLCVIQCTNHLHYEAFTNYLTRPEMVTG